MKIKKMKLLVNALQCLSGMESNRIAIRDIDNLCYELELKIERKKLKRKGISSYEVKGA